MANQSRLPYRDWRNQKLILPLRRLRTTLQKILYNRILAACKFVRRSVEINSAFVQISNMITDFGRAFHVMSNDDTGHSKPMLEPADQAINAIGNHRI